MPGVIPDEGEVSMLAVLLGLVARPSLELRLYVNDRSPQLADTVADYTELTGHGYAPIALPPSTWSVRPADPGTNTPAFAPAADLVFTFNAAGPADLVYGYLVVTDDGRLWGAQRFDDGPYRVQNVNDEVRVAPDMALRSEYP